MQLEDRIYEAAFLPELWPGILHDVSGLIGGKGALLFNSSDADASWVATSNMAEFYEAFFKEGWAYRNAKTEALRTIPHYGFICDAHHRSDAWMAEQPIYRDFFWKHGFNYSVGTTIGVPSGDIMGLSIDLTRGRAAATQADLDRLDVLRPHLARAVMLAYQLELKRVETMLEALELVAFPAAMIRGDRRVVGCNKGFEALGRQMTIEASDRLRFRSRRADAHVETFLARSKAGGGAVSMDSLSLPLPAAGDAPPTVVHVLPIKGSARDLFFSTAFLLVATPARRSEGPSGDILQGLFDLSPSEARVAHKLAGGGTVQAIAGEFGLSTETVRSHVKSILAKSGMNRQIDFVGAVAMISSPNRP